MRAVGCGSVLTPCSHPWDNICYYYTIGTEIVCDNNTSLPNLNSLYQKNCLCQKYFVQSISSQGMPIRAAGWGSVLAPCSHPWDNVCYYYTISSEIVCDENTFLCLMCTVSVKNIWYHQFLVCLK